jgi:hypothetical protein
MKRRRFRDPGQQATYDHYRARRPDLAATRAAGSAGNGYVVGYTLPTEPCRRLRSSLAYAAWAAGVDNAADDARIAQPAASNNAPQAPRVSLAMTRVLVNLYRGRAPWEHLHGRSMHGGAGQTERALRARGLVAGYCANLTLTDAGRECAASLST